MTFFNFASFLVGAIGLFSFGVAYRATRVAYNDVYDREMIAQEIKDCLKEGKDACVENIR